jgi:hypothetical protein
MRPVQHFCRRRFVDSHLSALHPLVKLDRAVREDKQVENDLIGRCAETRPEISVAAFKGIFTLCAAKGLEMREKSMQFDILLSRQSVCCSTKHNKVHRGSTDRHAILSNVLLTLEMCWFFGASGAKKCLALEILLF